MGYQNGNRTITLTQDGQAVEWVLDFEAKTVTVVVAGVALGTFGNRLAAMDALGLITVPAKGRKAA
jgi:hypothetical protein